MSNEATSPWSPSNPRLQIAWDSTSLQNLMFCARYYQMVNLEGWRESSVDLDFGILAASSFETFQKARLAGGTRDEAQLAAVKYAMLASGDYTATDQEWVPWGEHYEDQWRCTGTEPYRNNKGNRAKCPWSHVGVWAPGAAPSVCGECGSDIETSRNWIPHNPNKNRQTLIRLIAWYCEEQPEVMEEGLHPIILGDGTPAVELSFRLPLNLRSPYDDHYLLCGHLDYVAALAEENFVVDNKTTTKALNQKFWGAYSPHVQVDTYDMVSSIMWPELNLRGVILDAAQTIVSGARFGRHVYYRTEAQREEHLQTITWWIRQAERYAEEDHWPMNKRNCWLCAFKGVCDKDPSKREALLDADFQRGELWNPLEDRS